MRPEPIQPEFIQWSFERSGEAELEFHFRFEPAIERRKFSFREEAIGAVEAIDRKRRGGTVALCYTGGVDSELIALLLHRLGIPFELYFLDLWGTNWPAFGEWSEAFTKKIGKKVEIISVKRDFFYEQHCPQLFEELRVEFPTYLALPYLFSQIPENRFIVTGDGDLNRGGPVFKAIAQNVQRGISPHSTRGDEQPSFESYLPFATSSVAYWSWAQARRRAGEYCFFSSTPGILAAVFTHPLFSASRLQNDARQVLLAEFPEIENRPRSTNWDGRAGRENVWLRNWLSRHAQHSERLRGWRSSTGTWVNLNSIFYS